MLVGHKGLAVLAFGTLVATAAVFWPSDGSIASPVPGPNGRETIRTRTPATPATAAKSSTPPPNRSDLPDARTRRLEAEDALEQQSSEARHALIARQRPRLQRLAVKAEQRGETARASMLRQRLADLEHLAQE